MLFNVVNTLSDNDRELNAIVTLASLDCHGEWDPKHRQLLCNQEISILRYISWQL